MPLYVKHSDTVTTPKVTGTNYLEAKKVIEEAGLEIIQGDIKYDESIPDLDPGTPFASAKRNI